MSLLSFEVGGRLSSATAILFALAGCTTQEQAHDRSKLLIDTFIDFHRNVSRPLIERAQAFGLVQQGEPPTPTRAAFLYPSRRNLPIRLAVVVLKNEHAAIRTYQVTLNIDPAITCISRSDMSSRLVEAWRLETTWIHWISPGGSLHGGAETKSIVEWDFVYNGGKFRIENVFYTHDCVTEITSLVQESALPHSS